jgi:outer membrane protein assembly factor BamE (lipoprotein component of BamABCDE complex)
MTLLRILLATSLALVVGACSRIKDSKGYIADDEMIASVQAGVDNKASVMKALGRPTIESSLDKNLWYYVSQRTERFAFLNPKPVVHQVLIVRFDDKGNVKEVTKMGMDQLVSVDPSDDKTPTRGKEISVLQQIFGNIGRFSPGGGGGPPQ